MVVSFKQMFLLQKEFQKLLTGKKLPIDSLEDYQYSMLHMMCEMGEVLKADSRWKNNKGREYNKKEKLTEIVDLLHFVINLALFSGFDWDEVSAEFYRKNKINFSKVRLEKQKEDSIDYNS